MSFEGLDLYLFYAFAGVAFVSAVAMITQRNPMYSAFAFIVTLCSLSAIYALLGASFIAVLQIVVYAGAIMVLFLFVLMLLDVKAEEPPPRERSLTLWASVLGGAFLFQVGTVLVGTRWGAASTTFSGSPETVARELFSARFVYVFEATSILILAALVGAVVLAKREP